MRKNFQKTGKRITAVALTAVLAFGGIPGYFIKTSDSIVIAAEADSVKTEEQKLEDIFTTIDLMDATVAELTKEMEEGTLTAKQLVQMYIDRINAYDQSLNLNSIININPNALSQAEELDKERAEGKIKGKLHGIPVIVKDNYDVEGMPTTAGCLSLQNSIAPKDSFAVKQLKDQGAIILAKANMSEFASSGSNSRSTIGGTVHNAYDTSRTAAGSSGGTAVAITANFAAAGFGTDTGSSIRRPSSFSNLYGIRPSKGLTSISGVVPLIAARDVTGPICRSAEDMALMLDVIAGTDESDSYTVAADANALKGSGYISILSADGLKGKKIGFLQNSFGYNVSGKEEELKKEDKVALDSKVSGMVTKTISTLKKAGAEIVNMDEMLPETLYNELSSKVPYADTGEYDLNKYFKELGDSAPYKTVYELMKTGDGVGYTNLYDGEATSFDSMTNPYETQEYADMWAGMTNFRNTVSKIMKDNGIDAIMYVSQTDVCDKEETSSNHNNKAAYINKFGPVAGLPDMMIPMGMAKTDAANGYDHELPLGMSMFSSYGNEKTLMEIAYAYEQNAGSSIRQQPYTTPALEDENVDDFLDELLDKVYSIDYTKYTVYPSSKIKKMEKKADTVFSVDTSDVYATYKAAKELAKSYDNVMKELAGKEKPETTEAPKTTAAPTTTAAPATTTATVTTAAPATTEKPATVAAPKKGTVLKDKTSGDTYKVTKAKSTVELKKGKKKVVTEKVPDTITMNGITYKVTSIAANAFKGNKKLKTVEIGANVTTIGDNAFSGCTTIKKIIIPSEVSKIGKNAFYNCKKLNDITVQTEKLTTKNVGKDAFKKLASKTKVSVPKSKLKTYKKLLSGKGFTGKVKEVK